MLPDDRACKDVMCVVIGHFIRSRSGSSVMEVGPCTDVSWRFACAYIVQSPLRGNSPLRRYREEQLCAGRNGIVAHRLEVIMNVNPVQRNAVRLEATPFGDAVSRNVETTGVFVCKFSDCCILQWTFSGILFRCRPQLGHSHRRGAARFRCCVFPCWRISRVKKRMLSVHQFVFYLSYVS